MNKEEYNILMTNLPIINEDTLKDYYSKALENEGNTNKILSLNWDDYNIGFGKYEPNKIVLSIENCGVKTAENGWEELGDINLGYNLKTKQWSLLF